MITKKEYARYLIMQEAREVVKSKGIDPNNIRWDTEVKKAFCEICLNADTQAYMSTTIGIACETLGIINDNTKHYLANRGGVLISALDQFSGNLITLSLREIMNLLPDEIEREAAIYDPDERIGMVLTFLANESPAERAKVRMIHYDDGDFGIAYDPGKKTED